MRREVKAMEPVRIAKALREAPGMWVAFKDGVMVATQPTPDALFRELREKGIADDATVIRSPGEDEPVLIGLG